MTVWLVFQICISKDRPSLSLQTHFATRLSGAVTAVCTKLQKRPCAGLAYAFVKGLYTSKISYCTSW
jgi:hypothetical protein